MQKECFKCKNFFSKPLTCSKEEWKTRKFCSHSCANSVNSKGNKHSLGKTPWNKGKKFGKSPFNTQIVKVCLECESYFKVKKHRENTARFCSRICAYQNRDFGVTPLNEKIRKSSAYKAWRTLIFERDDYVCQCCKIRGGTLHADHIKPFALFPELRFEVGNGRTLCIECHKNTPTYGGQKIYKKHKVAVEA